MSLLQAFILGIIQGVAEFLPISSSGHLQLGNYFLGLPAEGSLLFTLLLHGATALSAVVVFRKEIIRLTTDLLRWEWNESTRFVVMIFVSMIPVGVVGVFFEPYVEVLFTNQIGLVGVMLLVTAALLSFTYFHRSHQGTLTLKRAFLIGLAQAIAILPGISRSGATLSTALSLGVDKATATRFSFLMVIPPVLGAMLLTVVKLGEHAHGAPSLTDPSLWVGFVAAFISGLLACRWMIALVQKGKLIYFSIYCSIVGVAAIIGSVVW